MEELYGNLRIMQYEFHLQMTGFSLVEKFYFSLAHRQTYIALSLQEPSLTANAVGLNVFVLYSGPRSMLYSTATLTTYISSVLGSDHFNLVHLENGWDIHLY